VLRRPPTLLDRKILSRPAGAIRGPIRPFGVASFTVRR
jgi:hypothetical protein